MLGNLLRRFTRSTPPVAVAPRPALEQAPVGSPVAHAVPERESRDTVRWLELDLRTRISELQNSLSSQDRTGDAPRFLDELTDRFEAVVRQPPLAAQRALSISRDPNASTGKLVNLVETDPGLSQGLLRYANSAFYATSGGRCVSLHNAVQRVGTAGVHNVVLRSMVDGLLCRPGGSFQRMVDLTWEHMVRTAPIARGIAVEFDVLPDEAYALGLLHDVGKLVIFDRLGELRRELKRDLHLPSTLLPVALRTLHEGLGGLAAMQWGLGASVAHGIATHHRSPVPEIFDRRCELLFVAERLDLARVKGICEMLYEAWWRDGALNVDREGVEEAVAALPDEDAG